MIDSNYQNVQKIFVSVSIKLKYKHFICKDKVEEIIIRVEKKKSPVIHWRHLQTPPYIVIMRGL